MTQSIEELKLEIDNLKEELRQERISKAEEVFTQRFVLTAIIFVILFIVLLGKIDGESNVVQILSSIVFIVIAVIVASRIFITYHREKEDAMR